MPFSEKNSFCTQGFWECYKALGNPALNKEKVQVLHTVGSTNTELLVRLGECTDQNQVEALHKTLLASAEQTAGRGRIGRAYYSPALTGIYFSLLYVPQDKSVEPAKYTVAASVAICRAVEKLFAGYKKSAQIKWVNDVIVGGKKVCGILTEGFMLPNAEREPRISALVIGIGINIVMNEDAPAELLARAGGILTQAEYLQWEKNNSRGIRAALLAQCVHELLGIIEKNEDIMAEYKSRSFLTGKTVTVTPLVGSDKNRYSASVLGISEAGGLLVRLANGSEKELNTGEVSLHE